MHLRACDRAGQTNPCRRGLHHFWNEGLESGSVLSISSQL